MTADCHTQGTGPLLVGDGIEDPHNCATLLHAAKMFGWQCAFRDRHGLAAALDAASSQVAPMWTTHAEMRAHCDSLIAFDNGEDAQSLYGFRSGNPSGAALIVGNERRGIAADLLRDADYRVHVPMASRRVNCLNVAAAAAVGLYYLSRGGGGRSFTRADPGKSRPELLLMAAADHVELGSTIRSAAAFGWRRAFVEDRAGVWFGCDRVTRSEGRGAARRGKNSIRLVPTNVDRVYPFDEATIVTMDADAPPMSRANLARGRRQLIVLADEAQLAWAQEDTARLARRTRFVRIEIPAAPGDYEYRYRLGATIALAEIARQVGVRAPGARRRPRPPLYDRALELLSEDAGETVSLDDLLDF